MKNEELKRYMQAAIGRGTGCPDESALLDYYQSKRLDLADHVDSCEACKAVLADAADFLEEPRPQRLDSETEWAALERRIRREKQTLSITQMNWRSVAASPRATVAAAAILVLMAGASAFSALAIYRSAERHRARQALRLQQLEAELDKARATLVKESVPGLGAVIVKLLPEDLKLRGNARPITPEVPASAPAIIIVNAIRGLDEKVEIVTAGGSVRWTGQRSREQNVIITLPADYLQPGAYSVRIDRVSYPFIVAQNSITTGVSAPSVR